MVNKRAFISPTKDAIVKNKEKLRCSQLKKPKKCVLGALVGTEFEHRPKVPIIVHLAETKNNLNSKYKNTFVGKKKRTQKLCELWLVF